MNEIYWGGTVSLQGSIQALNETLAIERARANKAEAKLTRIQSLVDHRRQDGRDYTFVLGCELAALLDEHT